MYIFVIVVDIKPQETAERLWELLGKYKFLILIQLLFGGLDQKLMQSPGGGENGNNAMARMYLIKLSSESEAKSLADAILANAPNT